MRNLLLTCFLALLCLIGRYLTASSKVVDSPTEVQVHRSVLQPVSPHSGDTHRGGDARPDTFIKEPFGVEVLSQAPHSSGISTIDGGPSLRSPVACAERSRSIGLPASSIGLPTSVIRHPTPDIRYRTPDLKLIFGLVDQHLDSGAGEGTLDLQPAPVTVFSHQNSLEQDTKPKTSDFKSLVSNVLLLDTFNGLVDQRLDSAAGEGTLDLQPAPFPVSNDRTASSLLGTPRSDGANLPTPVSRLPSTNPSSALDSTSIFLRIELESSPKNASPNFGITLSSQELDSRHDYILQIQDSVNLSPGEFLEGTMGLQLREIKIPFQGNFGRLQIQFDSQILLQDIWVQPNDSLRLSVDQRTGKLLFLGPEKDKFRLQVQLQDLASAWTKTINPIMLASAKERILDSPQKVADYQKITDEHSFGWNRKMELLIQDSERLGRAKFLLNSAGQDHPVFQELKRYQDQLDPAFYDWLWLHWKGKLRKQALDFMVLTQASSAEWGQLLLENALESEDVSRIQSIREFPMEFTEALYVEHYLLEIYSGISFSNLTETLPTDLQNQVNAFFLVRQYKDLSDADSLISGLMGKTASPWIKDYLQGVLLSNLKGSEFINEPFWSEQGDPIYPESWKGKLVFLDFWLSGCGACLAFAKNKFLPLLQEFGQNPDILFVTITGDTDRELWKSTLSKNQLTTAQTLDLFAGGITHPALKQYHIQAFPEQLLLDKEGKILQTGGFPSTLEGWRQLLQAYLTGDTSTLTSLTQPQSN